MIIISEKKQYLGLTSNNQVDLKIPLYIEKGKEFYFNIAKIKECYLKDHQTFQVYEMVVTNINRTTQKVRYENKDLYAYDFLLTFDYCTEASIRVLDAYLDIEYENGENFKVDIGSVLLSQNTNSNNLSITRVKPVVNNYININDKSLPTTVAVMITLDNRSESEVSIKEIDILNSVVVTNYQKVKELDNIDYESNYNINDIIDGEYQLVEKSNADSFDITIMPSSKINLIIPFNYLKLEVVKEAGLQIKYIYQGNMKTTIIEPIPFFNSSLLIPDYCIYATVPD